MTWGSFSKSRSILVGVSSVKLHTQQNKIFNSHSSCDIKGRPEALIEDYSESWGWGVSCTWRFLFTPWYCDSIAVNIFVGYGARCHCHLAYPTWPRKEELCASPKQALYQPTRHLLPKGTYARTCLKGQPVRPICRPKYGRKSFSGCTKGEYAAMSWPRKGPLRALSWLRGHDNRWASGGAVSGYTKVSSRTPVASSVAHQHYPAGQEEVRTQLRLPATATRIHCCIPCTTTDPEGPTQASQIAILRLSYTCWFPYKHFVFTSFWCSHHFAASRSPTPFSITHIYIYMLPPPIIYHFRPLKPNLTAAAVKS